MKKLAIDVFYSGEDAFSVGIVFDSLKKSDTPDFIYSCHSPIESEYIPGQFYKRELPPIQKLLTENIGLGWLKDNIDLIIVDGFYILWDNKPGLGKHLEDWLEDKGIKIEIMGVAKSKTRDCNTFASPCIRGKNGTTNPLWTNGSDKYKNYSAVLKNMKGEYRLPDILKLLDDITKGKK